MENFAISFHTDMGIKRKTNQDSILIKGIRFQDKEFVFAVLCDGMGGMQKGELASATVTRAYARWFHKMFASNEGICRLSDIKLQWKELLTECNEKLQTYGADTGIRLGTTATAFLVSSTGEYLIGHVGDTRGYMISDGVQQLTEDHTFISLEMKNGRMTAEQAKTDARRNLLLQCIGVNQYLEPQFLEGMLNQGASVMLCSDGFRHEVSEAEFHAALTPGRFRTESEIKSVLVDLVELNKQRRETDNISVVYIKRQ